jgi:hypothetical protein
MNSKIIVENVETIDSSFSSILTILNCKSSSFTLRLFIKSDVDLIDSFNFHFKLLSLFYF